MSQMGSFMTEFSRPQGVQPPQPVYTLPVFHKCASTGSKPHTRTKFHSYSSSSSDTPVLPRPSGLSGYQIPRLQSTSTLNLSRRSDFDGSESQSDLVSREDLVRPEVRQYWVAHVRDLLMDVPDMEPTPEPSTIGTHVHSLCQSRKN